ncbi:hypothetical protein KI387_037282, partial [Taxus chinensis]
MKKIEENLVVRQGHNLPNILVVSRVLGEIADKMDVLMELTLNHLNICAHEGHLPQLLIDDPKQRLLIEALPLKEILEHKLNPLK